MAAATGQDASLIDAVALVSCNHGYWSLVMLPYNHLRDILSWQHPISGFALRQTTHPHFHGQASISFLSPMVIFGPELDAQPPRAAQPCKRPGKALAFTT